MAQLTIIGLPTKRHLTGVSQPETVCWLGRDENAVGMLRAYTLLAFEIKLNRFLILNTSDVAYVSHCRVCASVREDNPRALASGLSPIQTHKPYNTSMHLNFVHRETFDVNIGISMKGAIYRFC